MRLTPWFLPLALSAALLTTTSYVFADNHEPLDDEALEEEYGIKAGSVKRDEQTSSDADQSNDQARSREEEEEEEKAEEENSGDEATSTGEDVEPRNGEERSPAAGTGGTGSPETAIHDSEAENNEENTSENDTDDKE